MSKSHSEKVFEHVALTSGVESKRRVKEEVEVRKSSVYKAEPYRYGALGSLGDASGMLLRQFNFPYEYSSLDKIEDADHDRCLMWDFKGTRACFKKHIGTGEMGLPEWLKKAKDDKVLAFLKEVLKAEDIKWTGYRILGSVNRSNGYPVFSLQLFYKHPDSDTKVYSGENAPNVKTPELADAFDKPTRGFR